jgi:hypothetical protein
LTACERIVDARNGEQDDTRAAWAYRIGGYIAGGELEFNDAVARLLDAVDQQPNYQSRKWNRDAMRRHTMRSVRRGMIEQPRSRAIDLGLVPEGDAEAYEQYWRETEARS